MRRKDFERSTGRNNLPAMIQSFLSAVYYSSLCPDTDKASSYSCLTLRVQSGPCLGARVICPGREAAIRGHLVQHVKQQLWWLQQQPGSPKEDGRQAIKRLHSKFRSASFLNWIVSLCYHGGPHSGLREMHQSLHSFHLLLTLSRVLPKVK